MLFNSPEFAVFFIVVFFSFWAISRMPRIRTWFLMAVSLFFYACWDPKYLSLILFSVVTNYAAARRIDRPGATLGARRAWLILGICSNLLILFLFKYLGFATSTLQWLAGILGLQVSIPYLELILPVGISFYTFQSMSYTIDVFRRDIPPARSFLHFLTYVAFFPQLVAGPIVRAGDFLFQLDKNPAVTPREGSDGLVRILVGLVKKVTISDFLAVNLVDRVFDNPHMFSSLEVLAGIYGYTLQIYCDFSGYCDIAIGAAALLGFKLPENFNLPYRALDIREFWRRWHITLSSWLRDYLYIPLGGSKKGPKRTYVNLTLTMLIGGLWHGPSWTFVAWGAYHGLGQALVRWKNNLRRKPSPGAGQAAPGPRDKAFPTLRRGLAWFLTFHFVVLGWILFRAETWETVESVFRSLARLTFDAENISLTILGLMLLGYAGHLIPTKSYQWTTDRFSRLSAPIQALILCVGIYLISLTASPKSVPFIYFQF